MSVEVPDEDGKAEARLRELTKQSLDQSLDEIDGATLSRLRQARYAAINQGKRRAPVFLTRPAMVSVFSVTILAITLVLLSSNPSGEMPPQLANDDSAQQMDDFNLLANGEDLDLVKDLEFFEWLEQQEDKGGLG